MKAYIAASEYFSKNVQTFGVGVRAAFDELIARRDAVRKNALAAKQWYGIQIPRTEALLDLDMKLDEGPLSPIMTREALLLVFRREAKVLGWQLNEQYQILGRQVTAQALESFYSEKKGVLLSQGTPAQAISFLTARCHDIAVTSAFCNKFGIKGIKYSDKDGQRCLIFDAKNEIRVENIMRGEDG